MHADDTEHPFAPGSLLAGRYRVGERIGSGGTASVHRGRDELLGRDVALKAVTHGTSDPTAHERERNEVELLARLSHRALVTVFDAVSARIDGNDSIVIVMELVDGPTLSQRRAEGPIADPELLRMARDLAEALAVVHAAGIVHRDVKPSNILLSPSPLAEHDFDARLADFGIAAVDGGGELTATGAVLGTAAYLSPEQATGGDVGPAADVYALGLVLLETVTGEREFPGSAIEALTARMLRDPVLPPTLDERWMWLLRGMTAREAADRPTIAEVRSLLGALDGVPVHVAPAAGSDVATVALAAAPAAAAHADESGESTADGRTALLPAVGASALAVGAAGAAATDTTTAPMAITGAAHDADVEHLAARRRRRIAVVATVAVVLVAAAIGVGALAIQGLGDDAAAPATPSEEADAPATPSATPSPTPSETGSPAPSPSESAPETSAPASSEPAPQPTVTPTQEPAPVEPIPADPVPSDPVPSEPVPSEPVPTDPVPTDPAPSVSAPTP